MEKIKEQQDGTQTARELAEETAEKFSRPAPVHRARNYRSQRELEEINAELTQSNEQLEGENDELRARVQRLDKELEKARERVRQAEEWELTYRRRADELAGRLAALRQNAGGGK